MEPLSRCGRWNGSRHSDGSPASDASGIGDRDWWCQLKNILQITTIRPRLFLAFGMIAALTVVGSALALHASINISATLNGIALQTMPATIESLRLAERASALVATAPRLMAAEDEDHRQKIAALIKAQTVELGGGIEHLQMADSGQYDEISAILEILISRLDALDQRVKERIQISAQRNALAQSVRKVHEDLVDVLAPAIDDANFVVMRHSLSPAEAADFKSSITGLRRLLQIESGVNLLAGLLLETSMLADLADVPPMFDPIASAKRGIEADLNALQGSDLKARLIASYRKLAAIADRDGIVSLRSEELSRLRDTQQAFAAETAEAARLRDAVAKLTSQQKAAAKTLATNAVSQIHFGRAVMGLTSAVTLIAAGLIVWLYVGRNIATRLGVLSAAMRRIAKGEQDVPVTVNGEDEIAEMASALVVFRQAMSDVMRGQQNEMARAEQSEAGRTKVQAATDAFKRGVDDIIRALDEASQSMDRYAQAMTGAAEDNRSLALSAAAASEQALANASRVASSADEIARSVEEISRRAVDSANIARSASDEASAVIRRVEQLAASVGQINSVSKIIRDVAARTNLLALNATIEAARAGESGRGFAVVAQEVKALANQASDATSDITEQIAAIESSTSDVVQAMRSIAGTIEQLDEHATEISASVQQQDSISREIARSANAAAGQSQVVSKGVAQVSDAAAKSGVIAGSVLRAGNDLAVESGRLRMQVEHFLGEMRSVARSR